MPAAKAAHSCALRGVHLLRPAGSQPCRGLPAAGSRTCVHHSAHLDVLFVLLALLDGHLQGQARGRAGGGAGNTSNCTQLPGMQAGQGGPAVRQGSGAPGPGPGAAPTFGRTAAPAGAGRVHCGPSARHLEGPQRSPSPSAAPTLCSARSSYFSKRCTACAARLPYGMGCRTSTHLRPSFCSSLMM